MDSLLVVTSDHRIMVPRGETHQTIPAGHLCVGDIVQCAGDEQKLVEVEQEERNVFFKSIMKWRVACFADLLWK